MIQKMDINKINTQKNSEDPLIIKMKEINYKLELLFIKNQHTHNK